MKQFKSLFIIATFSMVGAPVFAATMKATCTVTDSRFVESTQSSEVIVQNVLGQDAQSTFPDTKKHDETIITDDYVTMAFSNEVNNFYSFSLERPAVDAAVVAAGHAVQTYAEVRFTNANTAKYEQYLKDGQMLKTFADCTLEVVP